MTAIITRDMVRQAMQDNEARERPVTRLVLAVFAALVVLSSQLSCYSACSCDCTSDGDCVEGDRCDVLLGICVAACTAHDDCGEGTRCVFSSGACTSIDACTSNDDCTNFTVCNLDDRLC